MRYKKNWEETMVKWDNYWNRRNTGRPLMCLIARKPEMEEVAKEAQGLSFSQGQKVDYQRSEGFYHGLPTELAFTDAWDRYMNPAKLVDRYRYFCETHEFMAESFPNMNVDLGPGCLAAYLGSGVEFQHNTIWYHPCVDDLETAPPFVFDPESEWFRKHLELSAKVKELAGDDFLITIPDIMENIDVLASLCGSTELMCLLAEDPDLVYDRVQEITDCYDAYYEPFYELFRDKNGGSCYMVFQIWGKGKTVKLQCDLSSMISPNSFRELIVPSLTQQASLYDNVLYHLDGKECIRHMDALMEIEEIDALQFTSGDAGPDGTQEEYDVIYDKAIAAGKSIWVKVYTGTFVDWICHCERIVKRYGSDRLFFHLPEMSHTQAEEFLRYAEKNWSDIKGTFRKTF
jgi:5-methyltetrahydrofolate--homocysteine methyltransferase